MSFPARYDGRCTECHHEIGIGDQIEMTDDGAVHADCVGSIASGRKDPDPCPQCFLIHAGPCDR